MSATKARAAMPAERSAALSTTRTMTNVGSNQAPEDMHRDLDRRLDQRFALTRARQHRELDVLFAAGLHQALSKSKAAF